MIPWLGMMPRAALVFAVAFALGGCPGRHQELSTSEPPERSGPKADGAFSPAKVASTATSSLSPSNEGRSAPLAGRSLADAGSASGESFGDSSDPALRHRPDPVGGSWVTCYGNYRPSSTPERDVTRLGLLCGPANGMMLVGSTVTGEATENGAQHP